MLHNHSGNESGSKDGLMVRVCELERLVGKLTLEVLTLRKRLDEKDDNLLDPVFVEG